MVGNETGAVVLSSGSLSDWFLVAATVVMAVATIYLYKTTKNQNEITEKLGKITLLYVVNSSKIELLEQELETVIEPLYDAIEKSKKDPNCLLLSHMNYEKKNEEYRNFWECIDSNKNLCSNKLKGIISRFLSSRIKTFSSCDPIPLEFEIAKNELISEVEVRYEGINEELEYLESIESSIIKQLK